MKIFNKFMLVTLLVITSQQTKVSPTTPRNIALTTAFVASAAIICYTFYKYFNPQTIIITADEITIMIDPIKVTERAYFIKKNLTLFLQKAKVEQLKIQSKKINIQISKTRYEDVFSIKVAPKLGDEKTFLTRSKTLSELIEKYLLDT